MERVPRGTTARSGRRPEGASVACLALNLGLCAIRTAMTGPYATCRDASGVFRAGHGDGIVSLACHTIGCRCSPKGSSRCNLAFYPALWISLSCVRAPSRSGGRRPAQSWPLGRVLHNRGGHLRSWLLVLSRSADVSGCARVWVSGIALWALLTYAVFTIIIASRRSARWPRASTAAGWSPSSPRNRCACSAHLRAGMGQRSAVLTFCLAMWLGAGCSMDGSSRSSSTATRSSR